MTPSFAQWTDCEYLRHRSYWQDHSVGLQLYASAFGAARKRVNALVVEIGFLGGYTSAMMLCGLFDGGATTGRVLAIDINAQEWERAFSTLPHRMAEFFTLLNNCDSQCSAAIAAVADAANRHDGVDILHLDGGDMGVRATDLANYRQFVRPDGLIFLHDAHAFTGSAELVMLPTFNNLAIVK